MLHARLDLAIVNHPRAHKAGPAMATWTWALAYTRQEELDGHIPAWSLRLSWCGEKVAREHARRLVEVGLFEVTDDGWRLCRYEDKNETREQIAALRGDARERMARVRANRRRTSPVTSGKVPDSDSGSVSGSDLQGGAGGRPAWFDDAIATVEATTGLATSEAAALWLQYEAARSRKGWAMNHRDAVGWVTNVLRSEKREARAAPRRGAEATKQPSDPNAPWMQLPEVK